MSDIGALRSFFGSLPSDTRRAMSNFVDYAFKNLRVGLPGHLKPAENFSWVQTDGTTSTTANQEFSIALTGFTDAPRVGFPVFDLTSSGTHILVLRTTRPASKSRLYLSSPSTNAAFTLFLESR